MTPQAMQAEQGAWSRRNLPAAPTLSASLPLSDGWIEHRLKEMPSAEAARIAPEGTRHFGIALRKRMELNPLWGRGFRDFGFFQDDLVAISSNFHLDVDHSARFDGEDLLKFHFKLAGHNIIRFDGREEVVLRGGTAGVATHPRGSIKTDRHLHDADECSLTLVCHAESIANLLQLDPDDFPRELRSSLSGGPIELFYRQGPLTSRMLHTINDMLTRRYAPALQHVHAHARLLDLMCMLIDSLLSNREQEHCPITLRRRDIDALHAARALLETHVEHPLTILDLARLVGLNRTKLGQGFKYLFGETVFDFGQRIRLEAARSLLMDTDQPISDIAAHTGYEHQSSFTVAFKSRFGVPPGALRRHWPK